MDLHPVRSSIRITLTQHSETQQGGGVYQFDVAIDGQTTRSQLWLPVAGPDISYYWQSEIDYFRQTWGPAYRARLGVRTSAFSALAPAARLAFQVILATEDMYYLGGGLDWNGAVSGVVTPCGAPDTDDEDRRLTLCGHVIDWAKRNNMMYGLIGREMGIPEGVLIKGGDPKYNPAALGHLDTEEAREAYRAGFDLYDGQSLQTVMASRGCAMQKTDSWCQREWPSYEVSQAGLIRSATAQLEALIQ